MYRWVVPALAALFLMAGQPASAQNATLPSNDWNGNWGFSSVGERNVRLLQTDIIEKKESGYYEALGNNVFHVNNTTNIEELTNVHDHRVGSFDEISAGDRSIIEAHSSTAVGSVQNSQTSITTDGDGNIVSAANHAESTGCQDAGISVLEALAGGNSLGSSSC